MNFALITEGPSEHKVIKHIIAKYFKELEPDINQIQPKIENGKQQTTGGWNEVLKYCGREELKDIFIENNFLVIQIDTDQSQTKPFNISHTKIDNTLKSVNELYSDVLDKLKSLIKPEIMEVYGNKIFFAICIHTIECWLLPLYCNNNHKSDTRNCLTTLNKVLNKKNIQPISLKDKNNTNSNISYDIILRNWHKKQDIINSSNYNPAFKSFINSLKEVPSLI